MHFNGDFFKLRKEKNLSPIRPAVKFLHAISVFPKTHPVNTKMKESLHVEIKQICRMKFRYDH